MAIEVAGIDHVVINVSDAERAMRWYQKHLGFEPERYGEWLSGKAPFLSMRVNELTVIDLLETDRSGENVDHISFCITGSLEDLATEDVEIVREFESVYGAMGWGPALYIRDPDGNVIELKQYLDT
jgi:catechol 2,3-dioxygenase-like lactoylglutathione lyase family enzyme|tara:strand:- start:2 stop:379 length:378 start_codon:yes stop_codon:yes gene_type:complete